MTNRNKISQFFITFPQWERYESPEVLAKLLPPYKWIYAVQEDHDSDKDVKDIHYHVAIIVKYPITKAKMLTYFKSKFPDCYKRIDVQAMASVNSSIEYFNKESAIFYEDGIRPKKQVRPVETSAQSMMREMNSNVEINRRNMQSMREMNEFKECEYRKWCIESGVIYDGWLEFPNIQ